MSGGLIEKRFRFNGVFVRVFLPVGMVGMGRVCMGSRTTPFRLVQQMELFDGASERVVFIAKWGTRRPDGFRSVRSIRGTLHPVLARAMTLAMAEHPPGLSASQFRLVSDE